MARSGNANRIIAASAQRSGRLITALRVAAMRLLVLSPTLVFSIALVTVAADAHGQTRLNSATRPPATLIGIAIDSLDGHSLAGATVLVSGTTLSATTDSAGRFRIDAIPEGTRTIEIRHPLLDSLAVVITTSPKTFIGGDSSFLVVGIPSPATLVRSTCSEEDRAKGPAFVVGTVTDADDGKPSAGATVTIAWTDYDIGAKSIKVTPQRRVFPVSSTGRFRACGLPDDLVAAVIASRGSDSTAALQTSLSSLIGILSFRLPAPRATAMRDTAAGRRAASFAAVSGHVVDADGKPARGATVSIDADSISAITGSDGAFTLRGLRAGTRSLSVRKIGYTPIRKPVELRRAEVARVELALGRSVTQLKDLLVNAKRGAGLEAVGFSHRQQRENGTFLGPKQLTMSDPHRLTSVLMTVPVLKRGGCVKYFVDGFAVAPGIDAQDYLGGAEIGAVEVYSERFVPGEFPSITPITGAPCKAVVVWTKEKLGMR